MLDISWTEFVLIGIVALIVIGPKELPGVMRSLGQWTRKIRGMAAEFQNQFQEAMREAEMADLKKQVDDLAQDFKQYDPLKSVREDVEAVGKNLESPAAATNEPSLAQSVGEPGEQPAISTATGPVAPDAVAQSAPAAPAPAEPKPDSVQPGSAQPDSAIGAAVGPMTSETAAEPPAPAEPERAG